MLAVAGSPDRRDPGRGEGAGTLPPTAVTTPPRTTQTSPTPRELVLGRLGKWKAHRRERRGEGNCAEYVPKYRSVVSLPWYLCRSETNFGLEQPTGLIIRRSRGPMLSGAVMDNLCASQPSGWPS